MPEYQYLDWNEVETNWDQLEMNWEDVYILIEANQAMGGGGGYDEYIKGNPWKKLSKDIGEEKSKKFIKLFCQINGLDYKKVIQKNSKIKITVNQLQRTFQNIPNVKIKF